MTASATRTGPLVGVRVLELGGMGPVPFAGMVLADFGADVVRVERRAAATDPAAVAAAPHHLMNRGRRSIGLDLSDAADVALAGRLADRADVLLEGFRPGVAERLGLGPDTLCDSNPRLVYGRQTGWGQHGPLARRAGHDIAYIARTGALHAIGPADEPVVPLNLVGDFAGGAMVLVAGVLAALVERSLSGRGQVIDSAMTDGTSLLLTMFHGLLADQEWTDVRAANIVDGGEPWYTVYRTSDDRHMAVGALEDKFFAELCDKLGVTVVPDRATLTAEAKQQLRERFAAVFATRTQAVWEAVFDGADACVAPVRSLLEAPQDQHLAARETFVTVAGVRQPAPAPRFGRTPAAIAGPPPLPGADGADVLADWLCIDVDEEVSV
jgi:alpha-methylacyl-CoA racemase